MNDNHQQLAVDGIACFHECLLSDLVDVFSGSLEEDKHTCTLDLSLHVLISCMSALSHKRN
jgi:hypothetical protein